MKKILITIIISALLLNAYLLTIEKKEDGWKKIETNEAYEIPANFTVTVPDWKIHDYHLADYDVFGVLYNKNKTSGEWEKYTLEINGQIKTYVTGITTAYDGFGDEHHVVNKKIETAATVKIIIEKSDGSPLTIYGKLDGERDEYIELNSKKIIQTVNNGNVEIDRLPKYNVPISYSGYLKTFPNPHAKPTKSLHEEIYGDGKTISKDMNGSVVKGVGQSWMFQRYNWSVVGAEKIAGYSALKIKVESTFWEDFLKYKEILWISNEVPLPVKTSATANTSWNTENDTGYLYMVSNTTLQEGGFTSGDEDIPWDDKNNAHFRKHHPLAELKDWEYMPKSGAAYDVSSFDFKCEDAVNYAIDSSRGLKSFLSEHDNVIISSAKYNASKDLKDPQGKAGSYSWNLTFAYKPKPYEIDEENREKNKFEYNIRIVKNVTKRAGLIYDEEISIMEELGKKSGMADFAKMDLNQKVITMSSSERILKTDDIIKNDVCNPITGEFDWKDLSYHFIIGNLSVGELPSITLLETLTGIKADPPKARTSWLLQKDTIYKNGETTSAAIDAESGQFIYILKVEGTVLYTIFG